MRISEMYIVGIPDLRDVSVNQPDDGDAANTQTATITKGFNNVNGTGRGDMQTAARLFAKNEQKISAEIADAQGAEIIKRQERRPQAEMPRAERRVKGHPD